MPRNKYIANGYILAGGKSARMGTDKGLLTIKNKPVIQHIIDQLRSVVKKMVIVSANPEYERFGVELIADRIINIGPAGGIHAALSHSDKEKNFTISCDMPLVTSEAIKYMIRQSANSQITLPCYKERIEPLFGVYSKTCLPQWQALIDRGFTKLLDIITHFDFRKLPVDDNSLFNEMLFTNLNTKTDFEKLIHHFTHGN